jgi:carboxynorspermidine decarboxylase
MIRQEVSEEERTKEIEGLLARYLLPRIEHLPSPAFVLSEEVLLANLDEYLNFLRPLSVQLLSSCKPCTFDFVLASMADRVAGFDVSSLAEARWVRKVVGSKPIHFSSPSLSLSNWKAIASAADCVNVNSLSMLQRIEPLWGEQGSRLGLRINPGISSAKDSRYDPARPGSKLGVPRPLFERLAHELSGLRSLSGLHFHICCESRSFVSITESLGWLIRAARPLLEKVEYLNFGGGWSRPSRMSQREELAAALERVRQVSSARIYAEPGSGLVRDAGVLFTRVIDVLDSGAGQVAIVDSHVGHAPEVYEYRWSPELFAPGNDVQAEGHEYEVAGSSCLAGDVFGKYRFHRPLEIGQPLFFHHLGAYSWAKASTFNGLLLPSVFRMATDGSLREMQRSDPSRYWDHWRTDDPNRSQSRIDP